MRMRPDGQLLGIASSRYRPTVEVPVDVGDLGTGPTLDIGATCRSQADAVPPARIRSYIQVAWTITHGCTQHLCLG